MLYTITVVIIDLMRGANNMKPIVVGIAGGTGSGKSTLASSIKKYFGDKAIFLCHDNSPPHTFILSNYFVYVKIWSS